MKRIFSTVLILSMIVGLFANVSVFAESESGDVSLYKLDFLEELGITEHIDSDSYNANVTREDFAFYIANANKLDTKSTQNKRKFIDVPLDSYAFSHINVLAESGIISGDNDSEFRPKESITYCEAYVMLLNSLGYRDLCMAYGGFPNGYMKAARMLKLNASDPNANVTYLEAMDMVYEALQLNLYSVTAIEGDAFKYSESDDTWLSSVFGLKHTTGTVESVYGATMYSDKIMDEKMILISGKQYSVRDTFDESGFLGNYVKYFYNDKDDEVFYICVENIRKSDIVRELKLIDSISRNEVSLFNDDEETNSSKYTLQSESIIVYNGMPLSNHVDSVLSELKNGKGTITLKDSDDSGKYDTVIIESYRSFLINSISTSDKTIYNKLIPYDSVKFSDREYVKIVSGGKSITFDELSAKTFLDIAESINGEMIRAVVAEKPMTAKISVIRNDTVLIDDKEYNIEKSYIEDFKAFARVGQEYSMYIDTFGNIAYIQNASSRKMTYGYLVKAIVSDDGIEKNAILKIFTENNEMIKAETSDKLEIDGVSFAKASAENIVNYFGGKRQLVEFTKDSSGKINYVDTAAVINDNEDEDYSLRPVYEDTTQSQWYQRGRYGLNALFGGTTVSFYVPENDDAEDKYYSTGSYSKIFPYEVVKSAEVYYRSDSSPYIDVMVSKASTTSKSSDAAAILMVDSVSQTLDDDGFEILEITGYNGSGSYITVKIEEDKCITSITDKSGNVISAIPDKGDLVIVWQNDMSLSGEYANAEKVFDVSEQEYPTSFIDNGAGQLLYQLGDNIGAAVGYKASTQLSFGYIKKKFDSNVISWSATLGAESTERGVSSGKIAVYDKETDTVSVNDDSEIIDYENGGNKCSRVFYHTWIGVYEGIFIYNL